MRTPRARLLAAAAAPIIFLAACSGSDTETDNEASTASAAEDSMATSAPGDDASATSAAPMADLSGITVETTANDEDVEVPTLMLNGQPFPEAELPFTVPTTSIEQVEEGDGEEVTEGQEVSVRYLAVNGTSGEELLSTFPTDESVVMDLSNESLLSSFVQSLPGQKAGGSFILAMPPSEGFGEAGNANLGIGPEDTVVFYIEVVSSSNPLTKAEGEEVEPPDGLPTVETDGTSAAQITIPPDATEPTDLVVQPLIKGEGPEVEANQTVKVNYTGVKFSDGEEFDSSFNSGQPFSTTIGTGAVIPGWDEGLIGQTVGSRVLLVVPPDKAYGPAGDDNSSELAGETLVFVIDILSAN
ncbi:MAG: FKBP-type peptidyl-prolyl cis-trans isomerase [Ornithinimicrobium sp.]